MTSLQLAVSLMLAYGLVDAHVVDIHIPTASEIADDHRREEKRETQKDWDEYENEENDEETRRAALGRLVDKGEVS